MGLIEESLFSGTEHRTPRFPNNFSFSETPLTLELENIYNAQNKTKKRQHLGLFGQMKPILVIAFKAYD